MKILKYPTVLLGLFSFVLFFGGRSAQAYDVTLSVGNLCEYVGKIQTDDSGSKNVCAFNPYFASSIDYLAAKDFLLSPQLGLSIPQSGRDKTISKMSLIALVNAQYKFFDMRLILGTGFFFTRISGSGGTQDLRNGNSTVSFPMPDDTIYTRNLIVNLGLGADFNKEWSADLHTYVFNLTNSEDRAFSVAINGTYHFGEF